MASNFPVERDNSGEEVSLEAEESTEVCDDSYAIGILSVGEVLDYTVPTCSVVTVKLQHAVTSVWVSEKGETVQLDVFFKHSPDLQWRVPCSVKILLCARKFKMCLCCPIV